MDHTLVGHIVLGVEVLAGLVLSYFFTVRRITIEFRNGKHKENDDAAD